MKGLGSFLLITGAVFLVLRLLHVAIPLFHTGGPTGPVFLDSLDAVARYTAFSPRIPAYWPQKLGARPDRITVTRRPHPRVEIVWRAERSIRLREQLGGAIPAHPATAEIFPGHPDSFWWREGNSHRVVLKQDEVWIEVWTDLDPSDLQRVLNSLRPY